MARVVRERQVTVAESEGALVGVLVLGTTADGFLIDNVAVHPAPSRQGVRTSLLKLAEAEASTRRHSPRSTSSPTRDSVESRALSV